MKSIVCTLLLAAAVQPASAQSGYQLPRECTQRHNVDQSQCVIQDGPPPLPRVRRPPANAVQPDNTAPPAPATSAADAGLAPARKVLR